MTALLPTKLLTINAAILALYTPSATLFVWIAKPGYGLGYPLLFLAWVCAIHSVLPVSFLVQGRDVGRLVVAACSKNFLPVPLVWLSPFVHGFTTSFFSFLWDALGDPQCIRQLRHGAFGAHRGNAARAA